MTKQAFHLYFEQRLIKEPIMKGLEEGKTIVDDFPGEARRYVRRAEGYAAVIVNGEVVLENGKYNDARPGQIV